MADRFTEISTTGFGVRILDSIQGVIVGIIFFFASFVVLYLNEGREDLSIVAKTAIAIDSHTKNQDPALNHKLVSISGTISSQGTIGDGLYLKPGNYLAVKRIVDMFAWAEHKTENTSKNVGGSTTTETTYEYVKEWTNNPRESATFKHPEGHENPQKTIQNSITKLEHASIGVYTFDPRATRLPMLSQVKLTPENVTLSPDVTLASDIYLFKSKNTGGTFSQPHIGDLRISYKALPSKFEGTVFGSLNETHLDPHIDKQGNQLYHVFSGSRDSAIAELHSEYEILIWVTRFFGFLLMWIGLTLLFAPIVVTLDVLPFLGSLSLVLIAIITLIVSIILSTITILVSDVLHSFLALMIVLGITLGAAIIQWRKKRAARL